MEHSLFLFMPRPLHDLDRGEQNIARNAVNEAFDSISHPVFDDSFRKTFRDALAEVDTHDQFLGLRGMRVESQQNDERNEHHVDGVTITFFEHFDAFHPAENVEPLERIWFAVNTMQINESERSEQLADFAHVSVEEATEDFRNYASQYFKSDQPTPLMATLPASLLALMGENMPTAEFQDPTSYVNDEGDEVWISYVLVRDTLTMLMVNIPKLMRSFEQMLKRWPTDG